MKKKIIYKSQLSVQSLALDVFIQGNYVESPGKKVNYTGWTDKDILEVIYRVSGDNGVEFSITYSCKCDEQSKEDSEKLSPYESMIKKGGYIELKLTIPLT